MQYAIGYSITTGTSTELTTTSTHPAQLTSTELTTTSTHPAQLTDIVDMHSRPTM